MKWYWAILLTIVFIGFFTALLKMGGADAQWFVNGVIAIFGVWAAGKSSSVGWGLFVLLLWPIGFPCFLISQYRRPSNVA
jgi:hypothetical protein